MDRKGYIAKLEKWLSSPRRKPLVLEGARQVGKTWLMQTFAKGRFANVVSARFDKDRVLQGIFARDFDVARILRDLEVLYHTRIDSANTILLFDEIQACPPALTALKYFCEDRPDLPIIAAGSLLGLAFRGDATRDAGAESTGFPVGKVNTLPVFPMTFAEYLTALGEERLVAEIRASNWMLLEDLQEVLAERLRSYYVVGGMPEAVATYVETRNFMDVRAVHRELLMGYQRDISKHAPREEVRRIEQCWSSIPAQLAKENKTFLYAAVKKGGRSSEFRDPLSWLEGAGLIHLTRRVTAPRLPLDAYVNGRFKVYMLDVGLLATLAGLDPSVVLEGSRIFTEFKGALTEQYVCQELLAAAGITPYYWSTDDSRTEIDFVFQSGMEVVPLEVKAAGNVRSQSLKSYVNRFQPQRVLRTSMLPYRVQPDMGGVAAPCTLTNIPLWTVGSGALSGTS